MAELIYKAVRYSGIYLRTDGVWTNEGAPAFVTSDAWAGVASIAASPYGHGFMTYADGGASPGGRFYEHTGPSTWAELSGASGQAIAAGAEFWPVSDDEAWFVGNNNSNVHAVHWTRAGGFVNESFPGYSPGGANLQGRCIVLPTGEVLISILQQGTARFVVWRRPVAGPPWVKTLDAPTTGGSTGEALWSPDGTNVWVGGDNGNIYRSPDKGLTWGTVISGGPAWPVLAITGDADNNLWAFYENGDISFWNGAVWANTSVVGSGHNGAVMFNGIPLADATNHINLIYLLLGTWTTTTVTGAPSGTDGHAFGSAIAVAFPGTEPFVPPDPIDRQPSRALVDTLHDDFDGPLLVETDAPHGSVVQSASQITLSLSAGESGDQFNNDLFAVPNAGFEFGNLHEDVLEFETSLIGFTGSTVYRIAGMALLDKVASGRSYYQFYYREDNDRFQVERGLNGAGHTALKNSGDVGTFNGQYRSKIVWDRRDRILHFFYSTNNGASWSLLYTRTADFAPSRVILYIRQFSNNPSIVADFDYLLVRAGGHLLHRSSPNPGTIAGASDETSFPERVGPDTYNQEFSGGQRVPGPLAQLQEGIGPFDHVGVSDEVTVVEEHNQPAVLGEPLVARHAAEMDDAVVLALGVDADYADFKQDGDGNDTLGSNTIEGVLHVGVTTDSFDDPVGNGHWGAARDGKLYADGAECAPGDFGTLVGGVRRTSWRVSWQNPLGRKMSAGAVPTMQADDVVQLGTDGPQSGWPTAGSALSSHLCWYLMGDFDIQVDFNNWNLISGANGQFEFRLETTDEDAIEGLNVVRVIRHVTVGTHKYTTGRYNDNSYATIGAEVATSDTSGKLRITRVGTTIACYYWSGSWVQVGSNVTDSNIGSGPCYIRFNVRANASTDLEVDLSNFIVNSGVVSNVVGWAREAAGSTRGVLAEMPTNVGVVATNAAVDLLDLDTNKLWMRFIRANSNVLHYGNPVGQRPRGLAWRNGVLMIAHGSTPAQTPEGGGIVVDFTTDSARIHREQVSGITGGIARGTFERASGGIEGRNGNYNYTGDKDDWRVPDYRVWDVDIWHASGLEYHALATVDGMAMYKQTHHSITTQDTSYAFGTETALMRACLIDPSTGELFYMDDDNLYSVPRATWEGVMATTKVFSAAETKALPGTRLDRSYTHHFVRIGTKIYVPANEGVYAIDWPSGSFVLEYAGPGSGATYPILPHNTPVAAIAHALDGTVNTLVCGISDGAPIVVINMDTNTIHSTTPVLLGKTPTTVAAF